uniref:DUF1054 family protein n=1 Tax=Staphylococcus epidermidis TaxID=1282 RepID=UPI0011A7241B
LYTFSPNYFKPFQLQPLHQTIQPLNHYLTPQLHQLPSYFQQYFTTQTPQTFYAHLAKHPPRTLNPPIHTSLPFPPNKPRYKILPHFQIRFFRNHLFIMFRIIHQPTNKQQKLKI